MNKNIHKWFILALLSVLVLTSCDKYLDVQPKGMRLLSTVTDFELWLESDFLQTQVPFHLNLLGDTKDNTTIKNPPVMGTDWIFSWQKQFSNELKATPAIWSDQYKAIYYYNTVLLGIDDATGGTQEIKQSIKAEALLGRAFTYLYLVNLYGKQYNQTTSDTDLAVPFMVSNDLSAPTPPRSSVKEIYDHIIADITSAIPDLPIQNDQNRFRGSKAGAYSILARTYLYMADYSKAAQNAQLALDNGPNTIVDYSTMTQAAQIPQLKRRPDAIFARYNTGRGSMEFPTLDLLKLYNKQDKRLNFFCSNIPVIPNLGGYVFAARGKTMYWPGGITSSGAYVYPNCGTSVAEMRLILAEAAARTGSLSKACDELHLVRKCRFAASAYVKFESNIKESVLEAIINERIFEFPFHGLRWFDMRRLDAEGRMSEVKRIDNSGNVIASLPPHSNKYTLQIPIQVLYFNPDWPQNEWDN